jgi:hypothetical protein
MKKATLLLAIALLAGFFAQAQNSLNVSGTWNISVQTDAGSGTPIFVLQQEGERITGTYSGQLGKAPVTGTLQGNVIHIEFAIDGNKIVYDGTATATEMEGTVDLAGMATGTFKGKKPQ